MLFTYSRMQITRETTFLFYFVLRTDSKLQGSHEMNESRVKLWFAPRAASAKRKRHPFNPQSGSKYFSFRQPWNTARLSELSNDSRKQGRGQINKRTRCQRLFHRHLAARLLRASWWSFTPRDEWVLGGARIKEESSKEFRSLVRRPLRGTEKCYKEHLIYIFANLIIQLLGEL